jgi:hypothetical protein
MTTENIENIIQILSQKGVRFEIGLSEEEVLQVEEKFNFKFPPDLKLFLQKALPISENFVNWRLGIKSNKETNKIVDRLEYPLDGMLFDIEKNNFWVSNWGKKPESLQDKILVAKKNYETYPKLIPVYLHRYIPSLPNEIGNAIFSVWQMDIIYYGINLENYFANEFEYTESGFFELDEYPVKKIEFWSQIAEDENIYN